MLYGVTDTMGEISAASLKQSSGDAQVGEAVTQMHPATQQNASLMKEVAAAADGLKNQPQELAQARLPAPYQRLKRRPTTKTTGLPFKPVCYCFYCLKHLNSPAGERKSLKMVNYPVGGCFKVLHPGPWGLDCALADELPRTNGLH